MNPAELAAALDKYAAADLRAAKREGYILVCQTKVGTVTVTHEAGVYTLTGDAVVTNGGAAVLPGKVFASGKPAVVRPVLASLYAVEVQS
jgi:hypothetical protein